MNCFPKHLVLQTRAVNQKGQSVASANEIARAIRDRLGRYVEEIAMGALEEGEKERLRDHACCKDCAMERVEVRYTPGVAHGPVEFVVNPQGHRGGTHTLDGLFVCPPTLRLHLCGSGLCDLSGGHGVCEDGAYACLLTGMIVDSGDWIGKTWQQDDYDKGSGEHLAWKADRQHSKKEVMGEKLWNNQFDSLKADVQSFQVLLRELLPGGLHSQRIHRKIKSGILKKCKLRVLNCIRRCVAKGRLDVMKIKETMLSALQRCYIECNGLRVMCVDARQRRSIANAYTAAIFNMYNELSASKWTRVKDGGLASSTGPVAPPRRTMRFVQFGFNVLMMSQSGLSVNSNQVIQEDAFLKSALPCVHHIIKDDVLLAEHSYIKYMAKSTKRTLALLKSQDTLPVLAPVDAHAKACSCMELSFCAEGYSGALQQFSI